MFAAQLWISCQQLIYITRQRSAAQLAPSALDSKQVVSALNCTQHHTAVMHKPNAASRKVSSCGGSSNQHYILHLLSGRLAVTALLEIAQQSAAQFRRPKQICSTAKASTQHSSFSTALAALWQAMIF